VKLKGLKMSDRKKLIYQAIKSNPYAKLPTISVDIKARTGTGVAIPKLMQLRDSVAAGTFDRVYDQLFALPPVQPKRGPGRPRKVVPHVSAPTRVQPWSKPRLQARNSAGIVARSMSRAAGAMRI
jgi:hypothetical protein